MDDIRYRNETDQQREEYEARCKRCGQCCGASTSDPCSHLRRNDDGTYFCAAYANRLGPQESVSGNIFTCVNIRDVQKYGISYPGCGYNT